MKHRIVTSAMFVSLLGFPRAAWSQLESSIPYATTTQVERSAPLFHDYVDSVTAAIGLEPLRQVDLPSDYRELRLWDGFGIAGPFSLLRIVVHGPKVGGQMFRWLHPDSTAELIRGDAEFLRSGWRCYGATISHGVQWCQVRFPAEADWSLVLNELEEHRVWVLPQTENVVGLDGFTLVAEILAGDTYRTYDFWVIPTGDPDLEDAMAIHDIVFSTLDEEFGIPKVRDRLERELWCPPETEYSENLLFKALNGPYGQGIREALDMTSVVGDDLVLIQDEAECRRRSEEFHWVSKRLDYLVFHYDLKDANLVVHMGKEESEAEGCLHAYVYADDRSGYMHRVCF